MWGARPSAGKSAFALQAALYWAVVCNKRVGFFSHETSREKLMDRLVACASGVPMDAIKERTLDDKQMEAVCSISSRINSAPLFLFSAAGRTVQQMQDRALYKRLDIVIVDYLQIVAAPGNDEYTQVTAVSKSLHTMCQRFGIFCLALCQLSRTKTDKSGHAQRPRLEDLRSSGPDRAGRRRRILPSPAGGAGQAPGADHRQEQGRRSEHYEVGL